MNKFLQQWGNYFESSSSATPQWNEFYNEAVKFFKNCVKDIGTDLVMNKGHFYFSGFFTANNGKIFYFSCSDVRHFPEHDLLIRSAKDYKDYTGGANHYLSIGTTFKKNLQSFVENPNRFF